MKRIAVLAVVVIVSALVLSAVWQVPYIYTLIGFSAWAFVGNLVTADDDAPGGWSNPDGDRPFPWGELAIKAVVLISLVLCACFFPSARAPGGPDLS